MSLSNELVSQFVKVTVDDKKPPQEATVFGTIVVVDGGSWVKLDGSDLLTPITTTTKVNHGERVTVMIKDHSAVVTGNISSPSVGTEDMKQYDTKIAEFQVVIADKVSTEQLIAEVARITTLEAENVKITGELLANKATIENLTTDNLEVKERLVAAEAEISYLEVEKLSAEAAELNYAKIEDLEATNADIYNLEATYAEFENATAENFKATNATISNLGTKYASIDFANINEAAIAKIFADTGIIKNLVVNGQQVTGDLAAVRISGDLITAGTLKADRLLIKDSKDGLYYTLNILAGAVTSAEVTEEDLQNGLHGDNIIAKTITAEKIAVEDLVAFAATIGGFHISDDALYSGVKNGVDNTTDGVYLGADGQMAVGNQNHYVRFSKDEDGNYTLHISADSLMFGANSTNVEETFASVDQSISETVDSINETFEDIGGRVDSAETTIDELQGTADSLNSSILETSDRLNEVSGDLNTTRNTVGDIQNDVNALKNKTTYIYQGEYEHSDGTIEPAIILGDIDSDFALLITNTQLVFKDGSSYPAWFTNQEMHIKKTVIEEELQQGGFVWKSRPNGNLGLVWKGGVS